jgi:hypothetical protein
MGVLETVCIKQGDGSGILLIAIRDCLSTGIMDSMALNLLCNKSRMMREYHVRFRERFGVKLPLPTRPNCGQVITVPGLPTHKQEFCSPSLQPSLRCKTHAFLPARTPPSRQLLRTMTTPTRLPGLCHLARRDNFSAKVPGFVSTDSATNVYSLNRRAVIFKP